jgi:hypothetical protein
MITKDGISARQHVADKDAWGDALLFSNGHVSGWLVSEYKPHSVSCFYASVLTVRDWWAVHDEGEYQNFGRCSAKSIMQSSISVIQPD